MAFLTYGELQNRTITLNNSLSKSAYDSLKPQVFISHSSEDDKVIADVCRFINSFGARSYADNGDNRLKNIPSLEAAEILRDEIRNSDRFIVLVSVNSARSGWVPWELGLADGEKGLAKVAVLPISTASTEEAWASKEYLGLYPVIKKRKSGEWGVLDPRDNKFWTLMDWIKDSIS